MSAPDLPRTVTSVLVEEDADSVKVTWGLGDPVETPTPEYFGYGMFYYDPAGNGGKRFGVRFSTEITAWIFDNETATQANYLADSVTATTDAVVVHFNDATLGLLQIGTIAAYAHIEGRDEQLEIPVSLLR
ncbi:hypothetical protein ACPW96_22985 [Micromonospora sp. DT81.3]|uniref:hypothetical protein n=1 Tax=Micromonospora sp. DT81.3 TaxID=3416523 RepID=UPI003CF9D16F